MGIGNERRNVKSGLKAIAQAGTGGSQYVTDPTSSKITGSSRISVTGQVKIYCNGTCKIAGSGVANPSETPANFRLYGTETCTDIDWSGSADFHGAVYAPNAAIKVTGSAGVYGSVIGGEVTVTGSGGLHYDEALREEETEAITSS